MIRIETRLVNTDDNKNTIMVAYEEENSNVNELLAVINNVYGRLKDKNVSDEKIINEMMK